MGVILASEACIVLRREVETLALEVAWLTSVGTWTAESPDDALIRSIDAVERAGMASGDQIVTCIRRLVDGIDVAIVRQS